MWIFLREGVSWILFQSHSKGLHKNPNDCMNHPEWLFWSCETCFRHIFGTIRPLKIIFWDYIFENFLLKMNKNTFFDMLWLYKGNYYLLKLRNEEFGYLRSEYMTIVISWLFKIWTQMTLKVASFQRSLEPELVEIWKNWWHVSDTKIIQTTRKFSYSKLFVSKFKKVVIAFIKSQ